MQQVMRDFERFSESWWPYILSVLISVITAIRIYFGGTYCDSPARIDDKVVIITGGSSGIGLETAKELAKRGGKIILAIRNIQKGVKAMKIIKQKTPGANIVLKLVDLSDYVNIRNFVEEIIKEYDKIDILVNNAATISHPLSKSLEGNDMIFVTNYLGPFLLTHLLLPSLSKSGNGRVINVSASAHFNGKITIDNMDDEKCFSVKDSFAASKLALTIFTKHMARLYKEIGNACNNNLKNDFSVITEMANAEPNVYFSWKVQLNSSEIPCVGRISHKKVTFNSANPGLVRDTGHLDKYSSLKSSFFTKLSMWPWIWLFLKSPNQGCQTIVYLAVEPTLHEVSGYFFSECEMKEPAEMVNDEELAKALYRKSCVVVDLNPEEIKSPPPSYETMKTKKLLEST